MQKTTLALLAIMAVALVPIVAADPQDPPQNPPIIDQAGSCIMISPNTIPPVWVDLDACTGG